MGIRSIFAVLLLGSVLGLLMLREDGVSVQTASARPQGAESEEGGSQKAGAATTAPETAPRRILPGSAAAVDWLEALHVSPDRIVALPEQAERWSSIRLDPEPWQDRERYARFTSEVALGYQPDLVLVSPYTEGAAIQRIRQSDARVMTLNDPTSWTELTALASEIAEALGAEASGVALIEKLEARRAALRERKAPRLRVLPYGNFGGGGSTSGSGTTVDLAIQLAGFTNVASEAGMKGSAELTIEQILTLDFDVVLVPGAGELSSSSSARALADSRALTEVKAIQEQRFLMLSDALFASSSLTILDAAESLAAQGKAIDLR